MLKITNKLESLSRIKVNGFSSSVHGLKKVNDGYIFTYDGALYKYNTTSRTMNIQTISKITGSILEIIDFKPNQPLLYVYNDGIFVVNDSPTLTVTKISDIWETSIQGTSVPTAIYNGRILVLTEDYNTSFRTYALLTDGTLAGTNPNKISNSYPSNLVQKGQHVFFATGVTNGFEPILFYFNLDKNEPVILKEFTQSSDNFTSIIPIGVVGTKLYYFSNLDTNYGREIYYIETGIKTSTDQVSTIDQDQYIIESAKNTCRIQSKDNIYEPLEVEIFEMSGKMVKKMDVNTGEYFDLPLNNQINLLITKSKSQKNPQVFKVMNFE